MYSHHHYKPLYSNIFKNLKQLQRVSQHDYTAAAQLIGHCLSLAKNPEASCK